MKSKKPKKNNKNKNSKKELEAKIEKNINNFTSWLGSFTSIMVHSAIFIGTFLLGFLTDNWDRVFLFLTTAVSLEAIYLSIFIQMSVNANTKSLVEVEEDIDEIQHDIAEVEEGIGEIQEDIAEVEHDIDEMQEDIAGVEEDIGEIHEDIDELTEEEKKDIADEKLLTGRIDHIQEILKTLLVQIEELRKEKGK